MNNEITIDVAIALCKLHGIEVSQTTDGNFKANFTLPSCDCIFIDASLTKCVVEAINTKERYKKAGIISST